MSQNLSAAAITAFDADVKIAYQGMGKLKDTVRQKNNVRGSTARFETYGRGTATVRIPQTDVTPMNASTGRQTATLEDWNAAEFTDLFDQQKVAYDEQQALVEVIAGAITRRMDQLILDAADAASSTLTVSENIGGTNSGLNPTKLRRAKRLLDDQGVPESDRIFVASYIGNEQLLGETEATSSDYNTVLRLTSGGFSMADTFIGFKYRFIETRSEGGLPLATNVRTNYAYHKTALGLAVGIDFRTEINYIPIKTSWLANGIFSAGAVGIDALGLVEVSTYEA